MFPGFFFLFKDLGFEIGLMYRKQNCRSLGICKYLLGSKDSSIVVHVVKNGGMCPITIWKVDINY